MNRWLALAQSSAVALLLCTFGSAAQAAPAQLYNKSITIDFSVTVPAKMPDGTAASPGRRVHRVIYISSQGRLFQKVSKVAKGGQMQGESGPDSGGGGGMHFAGNTLVGFAQLISGANQVTISFDPSFTSCTVDVITGSEGGKARVWKGLNGVTFTATGKPMVSGNSCSIREGNAFAS
jgi:hypothetical protein